MEFLSNFPLKSILNDYTGLSPLEFLSISALMIVAYKIVCSMFISEADFKPKPKKQLQLGDRVTEEELRAYDGSDPGKPILMAIRGEIYDVTESRNFYGPGGSYHFFAGRDASRALALLSFKAEDINCELEGLEEAELAVLDDWEMKFMEKYMRVGRMMYSEEKWRMIEESRNGDGVDLQEGDGEEEVEVGGESKKEV